MTDSNVTTIIAILRLGSKERVQCPCGGEVIRASFFRHCMSGLHRQWMTLLSKETQDLINEALESLGKHKPIVLGGHQTDPIVARTMIQEIVKKRYKERFVCPCGSDLFRAKYEYHCMSKKHKYWMTLLPQTDQDLINRDLFAATGEIEFRNNIKQKI